MTDVLLCDVNPDTISERDFILLLISLYRECPELWKVKSKYYLNKHRRSIALRKMVDVLKTYRKDYTEETLKKKINILRTNFNKECRKMDERKALGSTSIHDAQGPTLWYYNELLFVKDQVDIAEAESDAFSEQCIEVMIPRYRIPRKKKKISPTTAPPVTTESSEIILGLPTSTPYFKKPENEAEAIVKVWSMKLSRLTSEQRCYAEKIINDTLFEAELGTLTRSGVCFLKNPKLE